MILEMKDSPCPNILLCRLKNLPFTFTKLKELAALWLSDNQVMSLKIFPFYLFIYSLKKKVNIYMYICMYIKILLFSLGKGLPANEP